MTLNFPERVLLQFMIPKKDQDEILTFLTIKSLKEKLFFTPEELEKYEIEYKPVEGNPENVVPTWNELANSSTFDINFLPAEKKILIQGCDIASKMKQFPGVLLEKYLELKEGLDETKDKEE